MDIKKQIFAKKKQKKKGSCQIVLKLPAVQRLMSLNAREQTK